MPRAVPAATTTGERLAELILRIARSAMNRIVSGSVDDGILGIFTRKPCVSTRIYVVSKVRERELPAKQRTACAGTDVAII
jgi:hypothetical protein